MQKELQNHCIFLYYSHYFKTIQINLMKLAISLIASLLILTSCTLGSTPTPSGTGTTYTPTKPTVSLKQSSLTTITNGMIATPTYGSGKMQVEIFADFQCPACMSYNETIQPIFEEYASQGKLTIVFRQFPLSNIHKNAK